MADATIKTVHSFLQEHTSKVSGCTVRSYIHDHGKGPVLAMVHGYPQSAYMWRHVIPLLKDKISLFIPELPGYGISSAPAKPDKRTVGTALLEALQELFPSRPVIWCGHDRGGRIGHRIIVDNDPKYNILGAILMDIVPTTEQWRSFSNPQAAVGYFHWPFLAMPDSTEVISGFGGGNFCRIILNKSKGGSDAGIKRIQQDNAYEVYCSLFDKRETIEGSCSDYVSGAMPEVQEQESDQKEGKKIKVPTMVLYSAGYLGRMHNVKAIWPNWVEDGVDLKCVGIEDGHGHYLPESAPEEIAKLVTEWIDRVSR